MPFSGLPAETVVITQPPVVKFDGGKVLVIYQTGRTYVMEADIFQRAMLDARDVDAIVRARRSGFLVDDREWRQRAHH